MTMIASVPGQVSTPSLMFLGNNWADIIVLPLVDGKGNAISWSGSPTFTVDMKGTTSGLTPTVTVGNMTDPTDPSTFTAGALGSTYPAVMLSLTGAQTAAAVKGSGRYYLRSSKWSGDAFLTRLIKVTGE